MSLAVDEGPTALLSSRLHHASYNNSTDANAVYADVGVHGTDVGGGATVVRLLTPGIVGTVPRRRHSWICG